MKEKFLILVMLLASFGAVRAQQTNGILVNSGKSLVWQESGIKLSLKDAKAMLDEYQLKQYRKGNVQIIASKTLVSLSAALLFCCGWGRGAADGIDMLYQAKYDEYYRAAGIMAANIIFSDICAFLTATTGITAFFLNRAGHKKINSVVAAYNSRNNISESDLQFEIGIGPACAGLIISF